MISRMLGEMPTSDKGATRESFPGNMLLTISQTSKHNILNEIVVRSIHEEESEPWSSESPSCLLHQFPGNHKPAHKGKSLAFLLGEIFSDHYSLWHSIDAD